MSDRASPELLMPSDPASRILQRSATQSEPMNAAFDRALDEPRLLQHFQVLRNRWLRRAELMAEFTCTARLAARERINHRPPSTVGQSSKRHVQGGVMLHSQMAIYLLLRQDKRVGVRDMPTAVVRADSHQSSPAIALASQLSRAPPPCRPIR